MSFDSEEARTVDRIQACAFFKPEKPEQHLLPKMGLKKIKTVRILR